MKLKKKLFVKWREGLEMRAGHCGFILLYMSVSITLQRFYVSSHCKCQFIQHCMNIDTVLRCVLALQLVMDVKTGT